MNELTQLELKNIVNAVKYRRQQFTKDQVIIDRLTTIVDKVQHMIDNYCEHEMTQSKINDGLLYCVKCKRYEAHE